MTTHRITNPFFHYYGAKWKVATKHYPAPRHDTIVEPFAGAAGYSCRYPDRKVLLIEKSPVMFGVWHYLIHAPESEILALPDLPEGGSTHDLAVCQEARSLIGMWLDSGVSGPRPRPCKRMRTNPGSGRFWGDGIRQRIARQQPAIRHWRVLNCGYEDLPLASKPATWYVDPPYQKAGKHYLCPASGIDFAHLGAWCRSRNGQVIVCENTGADWLPFRHLADVRANDRGGPAPEKGARSAEAIWTNSDGT